MIFNKDSTGASELKSLLGFIYKSNNFANLVSFIGFAERDIRKVIGDAVFKTAETHYLGENYHAEFDEDHIEYTVLDNLVEAIQLPVSLHAYRRYAVQNDLGHSDKGRFITVTETEKPAFEWMIDKSDKSLLDLAHEATDMLLEFLDSYIGYTTVPAEEGAEATIVIPWGTSPEFVASRKLFITKDQFNNEFFINGSRRVFLVLTPYIRKVQENEIKACIGLTRYEAICAAILDGEADADLEILLDFIRPALVFISLSRAVIRLSSEILPDGIFSNFIAGTINSKKGASATDRVQLSQALYQQGLSELSKLQEKLSRLAADEAGTNYSPADLTDRMDVTEKYIRL